MEKLTPVQLLFINDTLNNARNDLAKIKDECGRYDFCSASSVSSTAYNSGILAQAAHAARDAITEFLVAASVYAPDGKLDVRTRGQQEDRDELIRELAKADAVALGGPDKCDS